jgi:hypothetical protein
MNHEQEKITIKVVDEDDGHEGEVSGERGTRVEALIDDMYKHVVKRPRKPGDRLRCEGNGQDVFSFARLPLEQYVAAHCDCREWLFAGETGGA